MKILARVCSVVLTLILFLQGSVRASDGGDKAVAAIAAEPTTQITAKSGVLMDSITGKILFEKNSHEKMPPASITKIMTMLLVYEAIEEGTLKLSDTVTASEHASTMGGTQIWLKDGEQMSVSDLLKATAVASANDAAMALAEQVGGSEEAFVIMMNAKAAELGMVDTLFVNPTGLDAAGHVSCAYDIALMSRELLKHEGVKALTTIWMDTLRDGKTELVNTNKLIRFYKGATGLKTGTTNDAGSCVSATATRGNMGLISVVMGCTTSKDRFEDARRLLDYGFARFAIYKTSISTETLKPVKVSKGTSQHVSIDMTQFGTEYNMIIPMGKEKSVKEEIKIVSQVAAPVVKGQVLGEITLSIDDAVIETFQLKAAEDVSKISFGGAFKILIDKLVRL